MRTHILLQYRHRGVGHRHHFVVMLNDKDLEYAERTVESVAQQKMEEKFPNIFQSDYIVGLELVDVSILEGKDGKQQQ